MSKEEIVGYNSKEEILNANQTMEDNAKLISGVASIRPHDCWYYTETVYKLGSEGTARVCATCDKILEFRYRSFWKRLKRVFIDF